MDCEDYKSACSIRSQPALMLQTTLPRFNFADVPDESAAAMGQMWRRASLAARGTQEQRLAGFKNPLPCKVAA